HPARAPYGWGACSAAAAITPETLAEAAWEYGRALVASVTDSPPDAREDTRRELEELIGLIDREAVRNRAGSPRLREDRDRLSEAIRQLKALAPGAAPDLDVSFPASYADTARAQDRRTRNGSTSYGTRES